MITKVKAAHGEEAHKETAGLTYYCMSFLNADNIKVDIRKHQVRELRIQK